MARKKKPENETPEETKIRRMLESVANIAPRSEKVSWERKLDNMTALVTKLQPIEDKILDLLAQQAPIIEAINTLRREMVKTCTHPYTHLSHKDGFVFCKFCDRSFNPLKVTNDTKATKA